MTRFVARVTLVVLCWSASGFAQPAPSPEEVQQAQARWGEGKAFFDAGNYEAARVAFKQAYTVFPHPAFLQNLGEAELRCGRLVEAARHLSQFIRSATAGTSVQRDAAKKSLKKASEKLGSVVVETNSDDAEVHVDDDVIGRSPLGLMQWFVEPGAHVVTARKDGYLDGTEKVDVAIGPPKNVFVKLQRVTGGSSPEPSPATSAAATDASDKPPQTGAPDSASTSTNATVNTGTTIEPRTIVLIGGAALAVGAVGLSILYHSKGEDDVSKRDAVRDQFASVGGLGPDTCLKPTPAQAVLCQSLASTESQRHKDGNYSAAFAVTGGVLAAATVATYFLWPSRSRRAVAIAPFWDPSHAGMSLSGRF